MELIQGNSYELRIKILMPEGPSTKTIEDKDVTSVQVILGPIEKTWYNNKTIQPEEISFDTSTKEWVIFLTQADTLVLQGEVRRQIRIKTGGTPGKNDGIVVASDIIKDCVYESIARRVI